MQLGKGDNHMLRFIDVICPSCKSEEEDVLLRGEETIPVCACGSVRERCWRPTGRGTVIPDDIPGGILIKNSLCWPDGTPRRFYSKTEIRAAEKKLGYTNYVTHIGTKSGDSSRHTSRWI